MGIHFLNRCSRREREYIEGFYVSVGEGNIERVVK